MEEIKRRRSVRSYQDRPVAQELVVQLLEAARLAPSGSNTQPWHFIVVRDKQRQKQIARIDHGQTWMLKASVFLICAADVQCREEVTFVDEASGQESLKQIIRDTSIATGYLLLEAESMGLGACWTAWFRQKDIRPILHLPDHVYVCGVVTIGYPAEMPSSRPRRQLSEFVHDEVW